MAHDSLTRGFIGFRPQTPVIGSSSAFTTRPQFYNEICAHILLYTWRKFSNGMTRFLDSWLLTDFHCYRIGAGFSFNQNLACRNKFCVVRHKQNFNCSFVHCKLYVWPM